MEHKPTFTDYLSILYKWKKFLIINLLIVTIIATVVSFLIPEKFRSSTSIMIQDSGASSMLGGVLQDFGSVFSKAFSGGGGSSEDKLFGFLGSNKLAEKIIKKFNLVDYYEVEKYKRDKTLKFFRKDFQFDLDDNGFIVISMIHKNPKISAEIVNYAVDELNKMNQQYATVYAKKYREFVEQRYNKNLEDLSNAETNLENFQKKYKIYAIPEQLEVSFKAYAELESNLALKELEKDFAKEAFGKDNPNYTKIEKQVSLLRNKIRNLKAGKSTDENSIVFYPLKNLPQIQKEYLEYYREIEIQTKLLEFTLPMYEQAVMEEQKNIPTVTVIDKGVPAELKDSPKKAFIILSVFFLMLFILIPMVIRGEYITRNEPANEFEIKEKGFFKKLTKIYRLKI